MEFEWDETKAKSNIAKHGLDFVEAATVFGDPLAITFFDPDHSDEEDRYLTIGMSINNRVVIVSHTDREQAVRIISARVATKAERKGYEDGSYS
jgi:uncharacterized DUF497 family protein